MSIKFGEKRGEHKRKEGIKNREKIREFFMRHPDATQVACQCALGLSQKTVLTHVKALRAESGLEEN